MRRPLRLLVPIALISVVVAQHGVADDLSKAPGNHNPVAAISAKKPWQWTDEERARAYLDPAARAARIRAYLTEKHPSRMTTNSARSIGDVIDGARDPQLFFPTQLFEYLVRMAFVSLPHVYPLVVQQRAPDFFRTKTDWDRFASLVQKYAAALRDEKTAGAAQDSAALTEARSRECALEADAMRQCRRAFGAANFDRMLYEAVPPSLQRTFSADTNFDTVINSALKKEEECQ